MGRRHKGRPVDGILVINKPLGVTSNGALQQVKRLYGAAKAGHTGALDPMASGVLPLCFGEGTKFSQFLLDSDKGYITTAKLGEVRDTGDQEGEVTETRPVPSFTQEMVEQVVSQFRGEITQIPPMYSALKVDGQPLYKLARQGKEVDLKEIKSRQITIFQLEVLDIREDEIDLKVQCSKGTYIRSLVQDIGEALGCGAYVSMLHRTQAGPFLEKHMIELSELESMAEQQDPATLDAQLHSVNMAVQDLPEIMLQPAQAAVIMHGQFVPQTDFQLPEGLKQDELAQLFKLPEDHSDTPAEFIGLGEINPKGELKAKRLINTAKP